MNIYFSHGKHSSPQSVKIVMLTEIAKEKGLTPIAIDYTHTLDPAARAEILQAQLQDEEDPFLLVGSSMGGFVSMVAGQHPKCEGVYLMAPALCMGHYPKVNYQPNTDHIVIVHGSEDNVVPFEPVQALALAHEYDFHLVQDGHRLTDSLDWISSTFVDFLRDA